MTITNETKFSEFITYTKNHLNKKGLACAFDWYHSKFIKTGKFAPIVHCMVGVTLFSYVIRHDRIVHHKTAPYH